VEFNNPEDIKALLVGYSADAEIIFDVRENVLRIPTQALLEGNRVLAFSVNPGILEERPLQVGVSNWQYTEVISGLKQGDKIVLSVERKGVVAGANAVAE
jgi:HlyD family secretion protein